MGNPGDSPGIIRNSSNLLLQKIKPGPDRRAVFRYGNRALPMMLHDMQDRSNLVCCTQLLSNIKKSLPIYDVLMPLQGFMDVAKPI